MSRHACEFPSWEGSGVGRFMESLHFFERHWDHEPPPHPALSPSEGERVPEGRVRGRSWAEGIDQRPRGGVKTRRR